MYRLAAAGKGVIALASTRDYPANRLVWDEGKKPDFIGILVSGYLRFQRYRIDGRRQILGLLVPGDIIDEHLGTDSACSVEASTDARICRFDARQFQQLMARDPTLVQAVYRLRSIKLDQLRALIWVVGALSAEERLCAFLTTVTNFMPFTPLSSKSRDCSVAQWMPTLRTAAASSSARCSALVRRAGKCAPKASWAMRFMPDNEVIGMMPAMIGTRIPASSQRSRKS